MSQKTSSHIANANVAFINAKETQDFHEWLHKGYGRKPWHHAGGAIKKILLGTEKQKLWLENYNARKESIMTLVYNLVTQHDAENNILLASDTRRDSTSMKVIAALGMIILPGTFTAVRINPHELEQKYTVLTGGRRSSMPVYSQ